VEKNFVTALTAQNATETIKTYTAVDYTVPQGVSKLVEVGLQIQMAGLTTVEGVGSILEIESDDAAVFGVQQFANPSIIPLGTDVAAVLPPYVHDVNIPVQPGSHLRFGVTFNVALTINPSWRVFGKFQ
jgi:hypothetical protein